MAAERHVTASATAPVPQDELWELVCDVDRYPEWVEDTLEVVRTDGPAAQGSTYDERNRIAGPVKGSTRWTVVEHEPPRRTLHRGEGVPIAASMSVEMALRPVGAAATEVTVTFRYVPAFGPVGGLIAAAGLHRSLERGFRRSVEALVAIAEREHQAGARI